jgi:hypothetical protein
MEEKPDRKNQPSLFLFIQIRTDELQVIRHVISGYITLLKNQGVSSGVYEVLSESINQKIAARLSPTGVAEITVFTERELQFIALACRSFVELIQQTIPSSKQRDRITGRAENLLARINKALPPLN